MKKCNKNENVVGFTIANIEAGNFSLLANSFGQRYLFLKETNKEEESEFKNLKMLFDSIGIIPIFDEEKGVRFRKIAEEKKEEPKSQVFFSKRNTPNKGEKKLLNDIFWDMENEINKFFTCL